MKARIPDALDVMRDMEVALVMRDEVISMIILREDFGFGGARLTRYVEHFQQEVEEYESYANGGVGDAKLLARAEKAGIPVDKQIADFLRRTEAEAFRRGLK